MSQNQSSRQSTASSMQNTRSSTISNTESNYYGNEYHGGCYNCWDGGAAAAGAMVGLATGAAIASSSTAAATSSAYSSGYAAGSTNTAIQSGAAAAAEPKVTYVQGVNYGALPAGAKMITTNGNTYYVSGSTWFQPAYGATGVYYRVVPVP
jgi:hypothetical protein